MKKKLAEYLAYYIDRENELRVGGINPEDMQEILEQGLEAFESVNETVIKIEKE